MKIDRFYKITETSTADFKNSVDFCVGTGRMGLALQKEYQDQLELVQRYIGFEHIRGHGLFHDDMAIYQENRENFFDPESPVHREYNFTYLDLVMDAYKRLGIKPFLELGFMPKKLAKGDNKVFYWQGHTSPPKDYGLWKDLIKAALNHLLERYGEEVLTYPVEVWNEPNLPGFWENADMQEYFKLFDESFEAVKQVSPEFKVGGPAICGVNDPLWIRSFLEHCREKNISPDFITRHHYTTEQPKRCGHYVYQELMDPEEGFENLKSTRDIVDEFPEFRDLPIHITEFNTSYSPDNPIHDTNQNAAFLAHQLSRLGDVNESYSYWTFGDIFEENGVPFAPFYGGFGLVANGCIPKPTFWTFAFYKDIKGCPCVLKTDECVVVKTKTGYRGIIWNSGRTRKGNLLDIKISIPMTGSICVVTKTVDEKTCNPLKIWHDLGEPRSLKPADKELLRASAYPFIETERIEAKGEAEIEFEVEEFGVKYFDITPAEIKSDRGFDYNRAVDRGAE